MSGIRSLRLGLKDLDFKGQINWDFWRRTFDMHIIQIANDEDKKRITRNILEELPEWFGIPEAREE